MFLDVLGLWFLWQKMGVYSVYCLLYILYILAPVITNVYSWLCVHLHAVDKRYMNDHEWIGRQKAYTATAICFPCILPVTASPGPSTEIWSFCAESARNSWVWGDMLYRLWLTQTYLKMFETSKAPKPVRWWFASDLLQAGIFHGRTSYKKAIIDWNFQESGETAGIQRVLYVCLNPIPDD